MHWIGASYSTNIEKNQSPSLNLIHFPLLLVVYFQQCWYANFFPTKKNYCHVIMMTMIMTMILTLFLWWKMHERWNKVEIVKSSDMVIIAPFINGHHIFNNSVVAIRLYRVEDNKTIQQNLKWSRCDTRLVHIYRTILRWWRYRYVCYVAIIIYDTRSWEWKFSIFSSS